MKVKFFIAAIFIVAAFLTPNATFGQQQQPPIFFDAFLFDNAGQPAENFNAFFQWEVTDGSVDLVGGNIPGASDQVNGRFVELGGSTNDPGEFATRVAFPFVAGQTYNLRFDYKSSDSNLNSAQVSVGSQIFQISTASTGLQTFNQSFTFASLTNAKIVFQNLDNDNNGIGIDNVILSQSPSTQAPMLFDAFLFDNGGQPTDNFNLFFQWMVTDGSVDLVGGNVPGAVDQTNGRFVELGGSTGRPGIFETRMAFLFAPGTIYNLTFDYKSSDGNPNSATVTVGSQTFTVNSSTTALQSFSQNFSFPVLTTSTVAFRNDLNDTDNSGIGIDNVLLTQVVTTGASVAVGGRVTTASGRGIAGATIFMTDQNGNIRTTRSSLLGFYRFADVDAGETYIFTAVSKRYDFAGQTLARNINEETADINFVAAEK